MRPIEKILIANRGEIAARVMRTCRAMGIATVAVYADPDREAPFVRAADEAVSIGPPVSTSSFLAIETMLDVARRTGADAIHPGYGFLAENADFAQACADAGVVFIGPSPDAIRRMGSKIEAKRIMEAAGVPVVPGFTVAGLDDREVAERGRKIGLPAPREGLGGRGRKGHAARAGSGRPRARARGSAARGEERLRRRHAPRRALRRRRRDTSRSRSSATPTGRSSTASSASARCSGATRRSSRSRRRRRSTTRAAAACAPPRSPPGGRSRYHNAGTVEFVVDASGDFYFLEVNTRLQVEHPVTEEVTGLDLVRLQILVAQGEPLPLRQEDLVVRGHAIEARVYAEDPRTDFLPSTGTLVVWEEGRGPGRPLGERGRDRVRRSPSTTTRCSPR